MHDPRATARPRERITITWDDINAPEIDARLREQNTQAARGQDSPTSPALRMSAKQLKRQQNRRHSGQIAPESSPFLSESCDIQRRSIDGGGETAGRGFEPGEHFIDAVEFSGSVKQTLFFERSRYFADEKSAGS